MTTTPEFKIQKNRPGFFVTFANGYTISVQFGRGNYCNNRDGTLGNSSPNAEIAVIRPNGEFIPISPHDRVQGYVSPDEMSEIMRVVATYPESLVSQ